MAQPYNLNQLTVMLRAFNPDPPVNPEDLVYDGVDMLGREVYSTKNGSCRVLVKDWSWSRSNTTPERKPAMRQSKDKRPTWTSLVEKALVAADDFLTVKQLVALTKGTPSQVAAALSHLQAHGVVEAVPNQGMLYWFATPGTDDRSRTLEERTPEDPGTRSPRKSHSRKPKIGSPPKA